MRLKVVFILFFVINQFAHTQSDSVSNVVLKNTMFAAEKYSKIIENYKAEVYMRTSIHALKKNFLYKFTHFVPDFVLYDRKNDQGMIETFSTLQFRYPNNYEHNVKNVNGTLISKRDILMLPYNFLNINVYAEKTADERFILPLRDKTQKYYKYRMTKTRVENDKKYFTIRYAPAYSSSKLLYGYFTVEDKSWRIVQFTGVGNELFVDFKVDIEMGKNGSECFLPLEYKISRTHLYLGNKVQNKYVASIRYKNIELKTDTSTRRSYNIGETHRVRLDSVPLQTDTVFWNNVRTIPFDNGEKVVYEKVKAEHERIEKEKLTPDTASNKNNAVQLIAQSFIADTRYHYKKTDINYSGFLNPSMLSYSTQDGLNYRIKLSFKTYLAKDKFFSISSYAGYAFKYNDLVANLAAVFHYNPRRFGELSVSAGKGNRAFSTLFMQEIQDSLTHKGLTFADIYVNYYKDYYARIFNNIEIANGFQMGLGVDYHIRQANRKETDVLITEQNELLNTRRYFVPTIRFTFTPKQYYRKEGYEKIYVRSDFPTFKAEYARSFKNILGSTSEYNRYEFDISQNVRIGLLQSIQYHVGTGIYSGHQTEYFADFTYFARYNLPETWADGIGGVFNLLPYNVFNSSTMYAQAHVMYETPFLIFTMLPKLARGVLSERVYFSQLYTPYILSYSEIGYGIGNRFVNAAVFCSFHKYNFQQIGGKVVFLLGR